MIRLELKPNGIFEDFYDPVRLEYDYYPESLTELTKMFRDFAIALTHTPENVDKHIVSNDYEDKEVVDFSKFKIVPIDKEEK